MREFTNIAFKKSINPIFVLVDKLQHDREQKRAQNWHSLMQVEKSRDLVNFTVWRILLIVNCQSKFDLDCFDQAEAGGLLVEWMGHGMLKYFIWLQVVLISIESFIIEQGFD